MRCFPKGEEKHFRSLALCLPCFRRGTFHWDHFKLRTQVQASYLRSHCQVYKRSSPSPPWRGCSQNLLSQTGASQHGETDRTASITISNILRNANFGSSPPAKRSSSFCRTFSKASWPHIPKQKLENTCQDMKSSFSEAPSTLTHGVHQQKEKVCPHS